MHHHSILPPLTPLRALTSWQLQPWLLLGLLLAGLLYLTGVRRVARRRPGGRWPVWRTASFLAGLLVVAVSLDGGVGVYADALYWIHMVQHLLLIMVAPALLVAGWPAVLALHAAGNPVHSRVKRVLRSAPVGWLTSPMVTLPAYAVTLVATHLTNFLSSAMTSALAGVGEHVLYLTVGCLLLVPIFGAAPVRWRLSHPARLFLLLLTMPVDTFTGVVLLQTSRPLYPAGPDRGWGPGQVQDIQWSGAVMWIAGDGIMFVFMLLAFLTWIRSGQRAPSRRSWLERARLATLRDHTALAPGDERPSPGVVRAGVGPAAWPGAAGGSAGSPPGSRPPAADRADTDEDRQLAAYNAWLARLDRGR